MKRLYSDIIPYQTFFLETDSQHAVYVEVSGNPDGIPVIFLHGGPCSGTKPHHRGFFNPAHYRIILFDQRGCGQSLPFGELAHNTTQDLIDDMERIRQQLLIDRWLVFGGSWGGALALLYAQQHPEKVLGLIIRAVFLARQADLVWFAKDGVNRIYPERYQHLLDSAPQIDPDNIVVSLWAALTGADEVAKRRVTKEWMAWGGQVALGHAYQETGHDEHITEKMVKQVTMEVHYAINKYFIQENQILDHCALLSDIPTIIIHGRQDLTCPIEAGQRLHEALPKAEYVILPHAGHIAQGEDMIDALVSAMDQFAERLLA